MKKILLIGDLNNAIENLNECLMEEFQVQVSSTNTETVTQMLKIVKPDLVVVSLIGSYELDASIFNLLRDTRIKKPVLTISTKEEYENYTEYYEGEQFEAMFRPIIKKALLEKCREKLHIKASENTGLTDAYKWENIMTERGSKKHILVIDDSSVMLRSIKAILGEKYRISLATSGKQGLKFITQEKPDLILLDYEMPDWDGKKTFEMLKEDEIGRDIPVIFLTGVSDKEHIYAVLQLKPAGYILKPLERKNLLDTIADVFRGEIQ